jgi:hypothetical protein
VLDTVLSMGKSLLRNVSAPLYFMTLGRSPSQISREESGSGRGGCPPEVGTEPILRFNEVRQIHKGFTGEQVAEAGLG